MTKKIDKNKINLDPGFSEGDRRKVVLLSTCRSRCSGSSISPAVWVSVTAIFWGW